MLVSKESLKGEEIQEESEERQKNGVFKLSYIFYIYKVYIFRDFKFPKYKDSNFIKKMSG